MDRSDCKYTNQWTCQTVNTTVRGQDRLQLQQSGQVGLQYSTSWTGPTAIQQFMMGEVQHNHLWTGSTAA